MKITAVDSFTIDVPQKYPIVPYASRYIATSSTGALLIRIAAEGGLVGWGEAPQRLPIAVPIHDSGSPFTGREAIALREWLVGQDVASLEKLHTEWPLDGGYLQSAVEMALWDLLGKWCGLPLYQLLGGCIERRSSWLLAWEFGHRRRRPKLLANMSHPALRR